MSGSLPSLAALVYVRLFLSVMVSFVRLMIHFQRSVECVSFANIFDLIERKLPCSAAHSQGNALCALEPAVKVTTEVKKSYLHTRIGEYGTNIFSALLKYCNICEDGRTGRSTN